LNLLFSTQFLLANSGLAQTARGHNYFSCQPTCLVGGQEHCDPSDVRGLPEIDLTPTGLLMEGLNAQNACRRVLRSLPTMPATARGSQAREGFSGSGHIFNGLISGGRSGRWRKLQSWAVPSESPHTCGAEQGPGSLLFPSSLHPVCDTGGGKILLSLPHHKRVVLLLLLVVQNRPDARNRTVLETTESADSLSSRK